MRKTPQNVRKGDVVFVTGAIYDQSGERYDIHLGGVICSILEDPFPSDRYEDYDITIMFNSEGRIVFRYFNRLIVRENDDLVHSEIHL